MVAAASLAITLSGRAAADNGVDIWVGGAQCGQPTPDSCIPSQFTFTVPENANAVQISFTPNPNPDCADLEARIHDWEASSYPAVGSAVKTSPGTHTWDVIPFCEQPLNSWGGKLHLDFITQAVAKPLAPGQTTVPGHTITGDVDLYDKPGGHGKIIGHLKDHDAVTLNGPCPIQSADDTNGWCLVTDTTQQVTGAVWGDYVSH